MSSFKRVLLSAIAALCILLPGVANATECEIVDRSNSWGNFSYKLWFLMDGSACGIGAHAITRSQHRFRVGVNSDTAPRVDRLQYGRLFVVFDERFARPDPDTFLPESFETRSDAILVEEHSRDGITTRKYHLDAEVFSVRYDITVSVEQRPDGKIRYHSASYARAYRAATQDAFDYRGAATDEVLRRTDVFDLPVPLSYREFQAVQSSLLSIPNVTLRPQFDTIVGRWIGVCHPRHPFRDVACRQYACSSKRMTQSHCENLPYATPDYVAHPRSVADIVQGNRWFRTITAGLGGYFGKPVYSEEVGRWVSECDMAHPAYFDRCQALRHVHQYRHAIACEEREQMEQLRSARRRSDPLFDIGSAIILLWFGLGGLTAEDFSAPCISMVELPELR